MALDLTKEAPSPELNGVVEISAEWNHSCTSQCAVPCKVNRLRPGIDTRMAVQRSDRTEFLDGTGIEIDADGNPRRA